MPKLKVPAYKEKDIQRVCIVQQAMLRKRWDGHEASKRMGIIYSTFRRKIRNPKEFTLGNFDAFSDVLTEDEKNVLV